jgi:ureidoacrylate peracid hydrolase
MARISRTNPALHASNTALLLFDTLNGYLHPSNPEKIRFLSEHQILPNLQRLLDGARRFGMTTFYPAGKHAPGGVDTVARLTDTDMDLNPRIAPPPVTPHITSDSTDSDITPELAPEPGDLVVPKQRWNSFHQTNLDLQLRVRGIETIVIAGGSTDVGIASTVFSARDHDYGIVVVKDACYSARGSNNEFFMERVFPRMARIRSVDETIALMTK